MLKKGASLDRSAKKGGNRLYCSVKCLYFLLDGKSCFKSFARVVLKNSNKSKVTHANTNPVGQHITHAHNHFTRSISSHGQLFQPFGSHQHGVANIPGGCV